MSYQFSGSGNCIVITKDIFFDASRPDRTGASQAAGLKGAEGLMGAKGLEGRRLASLRRVILWPL